MTDNPVVTIAFAPSSTGSGARHIENIECTESALSIVRFKFNPSGLNSVNKLKVLAAAFITECEEVVKHTGASREGVTAITDMQKACMMAVAAASYKEEKKEYFEDSLKAKEYFKDSL